MPSLASACSISHRLCDCIRVLLATCDATESFGKLVQLLSGNYRDLQPIDPISIQLPPVAVLQQAL